MEGWPHGAMRYSSSLGILPSSPEFGVFLGEGKSAVFHLRGPTKTGILKTGSGSGCLENPTEG